MPYVSSRTIFQIRKVLRRRCSLKVARDEYAAWHYVDPPGWTRLAFQKVPEGKTVKNRLHLDVGVSDIAAATRQAEALGAQRAGGIHCDTAGSFQVLLDPEGNEWCLVQPA